MSEGARHRYIAKADEYRLGLELADKNRHRSLRSHWTNKHSIPLVRSRDSPDFCFYEHMHFNCSKVYYPKDQDSIHVYDHDKVRLAFSLAGDFDTF